MAQTRDVQSTVVLPPYGDGELGEALKWAVASKWSGDVWSVVLLPPWPEAVQLRRSDGWVLPLFEKQMLELLDDTSQLTETLESWLPREELYTSLKCLLSVPL